MDERYGSGKVEISKWMKQRKRIYGKGNIDRIEADVQRFFKHNLAKAKERKVKRYRELKARIEANKRIRAAQSNI